MTQISAKVIADSKNQFGNRITTLIVTMPRYILAEFNTHRMLSKNSASSRAIPFERNLESIEKNPFIPIAWMKDHKGMQGTEYFENAGVHLHNWLRAKDSAIDNAKFLASNNLTKQLVNRVLEPFMWHTVIVTGTEWENFFALRCPKYGSKRKDGTINSEDKTFRSRKDYSYYTTDGGAMMDKARTEIEWLQMNQGQADIHMMATAEAIWDAMNESIPKELKAGEWHIPFQGDLVSNSPEFLIKVATARCARVSYTVVGEEDKPANYENDIKLHDRLATSGHWSPFEHCAQAMSEDTKLLNYGWNGNFQGFVQYRKTFNNENITK